MTRRTCRCVWPPLTCLAGGPREPARRHPLRLLRVALFGVQGRAHVPHAGREGAATAAGSELPPRLAVSLTPPAQLHTCSSHTCAVPPCPNTLLLRLHSFLTLRPAQIPALPTGEIDYDALKVALVANAGKPAVLNVNIGTTVKGAVDDLDRVLTVLKVGLVDCLLYLLWQR